MGIIKSSLKLKLRGRVRMEKTTLRPRSFQYILYFSMTRSINLNNQGCTSLLHVLYTLLMYALLIFFPLPHTLGVKPITRNTDLTNSWQKDIARRIRLVSVWHLYNSSVQCSPSLYYFPSVFLQCLMVSDQIGWTLP